MLSLLFQAEVDDPSNRIPSFTIKLTDSTLGLFLPSAAFWVQLLLVLIMSQIFVSAIAYIVYHVIIPNRGGKTTTALPSLIGFGIVIPLCLIFPYWIMKILKIRNLLLRFSACAFLPITSMFHCTEAMFGFSPHSVEMSFKNYLLYYISPAELVFDEKTHKVVAPSRADIMSEVRSFVSWIFITGASQSVLCHVQYLPFENHANAITVPLLGLELFHGVFDWKLILNNFTSTFLLSIYLSTFFSSLRLVAVVLLRAKTCAGMNNPMLMSTSPSDFWGRRWNLIIHGSLKRGVFKPVYRYSSKFVAVWATFIASGLFHEYITIGAFPDSPPNFGKQTAFFIWNAIIVTIEHFVWKAAIFQWIKNNMPKPVVATLVMFTAMPVAHWFLHFYTKNLVFEHGEIAFPMVVLM